MAIFNLSSLSFSGVAAKHGRVSLGSCDPQSRYRKCSALAPVRSSFSAFLHNHLKVITGINGVVSQPRALQEAADNHSMHMCLDLLAYDWVNSQHHVQCLTSHAHFCSCNLLPGTFAVFSLTLIGTIWLEVCAVCYEALGTSVRTLLSVKPTAFYTRSGSGDNDRELGLHQIIQPEVQLAKKLFFPSCLFLRSTAAAGSYKTLLIVL